MRDGIWLASVLALHSATSAGIGPPVRPPLVVGFDLECSGAADSDAQVATGGNGVWVTVWSDATAGGARVSATRSVDNGSSWSDATPIDAGGSGWAMFPDVETNGAGVWIAAWSQSQAAEPPIAVVVARSLDEGQTWSAPLQIDGSSSPIEFGATVHYGGEGSWVLAWWTLDDRFVHITRSNDDGVSWETPTTIPAAIRAVNLGRGLDIATDDNGTWIVAWQDADDRLAYVRSTDDGASWDAMETIATQSLLGNHSAVGIETDGQGLWLMVWSGQHELNLFRSTDNGESWQAAGEIVDGSEFHFRPRLVRDRLGSWTLIWEQNRWWTPHSSQVLVARSWDDGQSWSTPDLVTGYPVSAEVWSDLATDDRGNWVAVWQPKSNCGGVSVTGWSFCQLSGIDGEMQYHGVVPGEPFTAVGGWTADLVGGDLLDAECLGTFDSNPIVDPLAPPPSGEGRYYLVRDSGACAEGGYGLPGESAPHREALAAAVPCP